MHGLCSRPKKKPRPVANLSRFLPKPVADQFMAGRIDLALGGSTCTGAVFSDIVGFTRISEGLDPHSVVEIMNDYFDRMVPCH